MAWAPLIGFIVTGWVLGLCLHEFGHAIMAFSYDSRAVYYRGHLRMDPEAYIRSSPTGFLSIMFLALGALPLPGGAVIIDESRLKTNSSRTMVAVAGPAMTAMFAAVCLALSVYTTSIHLPLLSVAFAGLAFLNVTAVLFNLLPVPGLDGYAAIESYLPNVVRSRVWAWQSDPRAPWVFMAVAVVIGWLFVTPLGFYVCEVFGLDRAAIAHTLQELRLQTLFEHLI